MTHGLTDVRRGDSLLRTEFSDAVEQSVVEGVHPCARIAAVQWPAVAAFLKDDSRLRFNLLRSITALDLLAENQLACVLDEVGLDVLAGGIRLGGFNLRRGFVGGGIVFNRRLNGIRFVDILNRRFLLAAGDAQDKKEAQAEGHELLDGRIAQLHY